MELTKELYIWIENECDLFNNNTGYFVDPNDVLYSYLFSTFDTFHILNDWDEGKSNDPFWNEELNEHSVIVFLKQTCANLKKQLK